MLEILRDNLVYGLNATNKVVNRNSTLPVLADVFINANESGLHLAATDLETVLQLRLGAKVSEPFAICVESFKLNSLLSVRTEDVLKLSYDEERVSLKVKAGKFNSTLKGLEAEEFVLLPNIDDFKDESDCVTTVDVKDLLAALDRVMPSVAGDMTKPTLTTVLFRFDIGGLTLIATDGYRLSVQTLDVSGSPAKYMIPESGLSKVVSLLRQFKLDTIDICFQEKRVAFVADDFSIVCQLQEGNYPDISPFEGKLSKKPSASVTVQTSELQRALKTANVYWNDTTNVLEFVGENSVLDIAIENKQDGELSEALEADTEGKLDTILNPNHILDIIKNTKSETITFNYFDKHTGIYFYVDNDKENYWILMPFFKKGNG